MRQRFLHGFPLVTVVVNQLHSKLTLAGAGIVYRFLRASQQMNDFEVWRELFSHAPHNETVEFSIGGQRMVFTADPENIRAILATQFGDYGKGEPFHEGISSGHLIAYVHSNNCDRLEGVPGGLDIHNGRDQVV